MPLLLVLLLLVMSPPAGAAPQMPYEGQWASSAKACRDPDGVRRMEISGGGKRFFWYESRCIASTITPAGANVWRTTMSCSGEGETWNAAPTLTLTAPNTLVLTGKLPVGDGKRDAYVRCRK